MAKNTLLLRWLYSASGHGKNACDGVGGFLKNMASLHNLRCAVTDAIRSALDFVPGLQEKKHGTHLLHIPSSNITAFREAKKEEWATVQPVAGIRSSHVWYKNPNRRPEEQDVLLARTVVEMYPSY